jgi:hypothetical protein
VPIGKDYRLPVIASEFPANDIGNLRGKYLKNGDLAAEPHHNSLLYARIPSKPALFREFENGERFCADCLVSHAVL